MIESKTFQGVLEKILESASFGKDIGYKKNLCLAYVSGIEFSVNAKIILWSSLLEKVLKYHKLNKSKKNDGLVILGIYKSDIASIKNLVDLRNDIAHGDEIKRSRLFELSSDWELLTERVILSELGFKDISRTNLKINP